MSDTGITDFTSPEKLFTGIKLFYRFSYDIKLIYPQNKFELF